MTFTTDKVKSTATELTSFDLQKPVPDQYKGEISSWNKLHKNRKVLKRDKISKQLKVR